MKTLISKKKQSAHLITGVGKWFGVHGGVKIDVHPNHHGRHHRPSCQETASHQALPQPHPQAQWAADAGSRFILYCCFSTVWR